MASSPPPPKYKSEVFIPIKQDDQSFEQRQHGIWEDMHERMEKRRREWEQEVENMRRDFFKLKPNEIRRGSSTDNHVVDDANSSDMFFDTKDGQKKFQVSFDVSQFNAEEINVQNKDRKLIVHAKHEESGPGKSVCREFSRSVDVPKHVDPEKLTCTLSNDGILQIEAPVPEPDVQKVTHQSSFSSLHMEPPSHFQPATSSMTSGPTLTETDGVRKFKISVDIGTDFGPNDVVVKTVDKKLVVQAKHETKAAGRTSCKEFSRQFDLPENVDPNLVTASMTEDGKLIVEAPITGSSYSSGSFTGKPGSKKQPTVNISYS